MSENLLPNATAWIWQTFGESIANLAIDSMKNQWKKFNWDSAAEKYKKRLKDLCGTVHIFGMAGSVEITDIFTDIDILDKPSANLRADISSFQKYSLLEKKTINALRIVSTENKLVILGKPGSGKTTLLKFITIKIAEGKLDKIPIFISLREWFYSGLDLISFISRQFDICSFPDARPFVEHILRAGKAFVFLDGLDEIPQLGNQRINRIQEIKDFSDKYVDGKYIISCRIAAEEYVFERFTYVEIADFDDRRIFKFVDKWFSLDALKRNKFIDELHSDKNKGLLEMAKTPLLLVLLCLAFDENLRFPSRKIDLYQDALDALLRKWDASRGVERDEVYHNLSVENKRKLLTHIAAETFKAGEFIFHQENLQALIVNTIKKLSIADQKEYIDGEAILKAIESQHGLFFEQAHRIYVFGHSTFQEYFAAKYLAEKIDEDLLQEVRQYFLDDRWNEIFLIIAGLLEAKSAEKFIHTLIQYTNNYLILEHQELIDLFQWSNENYGWLSSHASDKYLIQARNIEDLDIFSAALDLIKILKVSKSRVRTIALGILRSCALSNAIKASRLLDNSVNLDFEVDLDFDLASQVNSALFLADNYISCSDLGELHTALNEKPLPLGAPEDWQRFSEQFKKAVNKYLKADNPWLITRSLFRTLTLSFRANIRIVEFLKMTRIENHDAVEDLLFRL